MSDLNENNKKNNQSSGKLVRRKPLWWLVSFIDGSYLRNEMFTKQIPFIFYIVLLAFLLIYSRNDAERKAREIVRLNNEIEDLRFDFVSTRSVLMARIQQSQIAVDLKNNGIEESVVPPEIIRKPKTNK